MDPTTYTGYRAHTKARSTGTTVVLLDGIAAGITTAGDGDGRWCLLCDDHGGIVTFDTQAQARTELAHPDQWCPNCQHAHDDTEVSA